MVPLKVTSKVSANEAIICSERGLYRDRHPRQDALAFVSRFPVLQYRFFSVISAFSSERSGKDFHVKSRYRRTAERRQVNFI